MKKLWLLLIASQVGMADGPFPPLTTQEVKLKILANAEGMSVYVFDKDIDGVPTCYDGCEVVWPFVKAPEGDVQPPLSSVTRNDGTKQLAFNKHPLYTYSRDSAPGDINGDGVFGIWHVVHP